MTGRGTSALFTQPLNLLRCRSKPRQLFPFDEYSLKSIGIKTEITLLYMYTGIRNMQYHSMQEYGE